MLAAMLVLGAIVHRPSLSAGYISDDYLQNAMLDAQYPVSRSALDLYSFVKSGELEHVRDLGIVPWWAHPDLRLTALRPLSSALLWVDHTLFGLSAYARHVHSLLWWAALVVAFALLCRKLLSPLTASFALVLFAVDPAHVIPIVWLANRTALVSACFGVLGLVWYVRFRRDGGRGAAAGSSLFFALALAGGEYGLGALAYVVGYELFVATEPWRVRARACLPAVLPALIYVLSYALLGFGASASAAYISPLSAPHEFASQALVRLPALLATELLTLPPEPVFTALSFDYALSIVLVPPLLALGALVYGTIRTAEPQQARLMCFLAAGMLLSMLPLIGTIPGTRLLIAPSIGGSMLFAALFSDAWSRLRRRAELKRPLLWARVLFTLLLFSIHVVLAVPASALAAIIFRDSNRFVLDVFAAADIDDSLVTRQDLIVINAPDPLTLLYVPHIRRERQRPLPRVWRALSMTPRPVLVRRVASDALELGVAEGSLTEMPLAALVRRPDLRLRPNEVISLERLSVQVLEVGEHGPLRVRFKFSESLDSDSIRLLVLLPEGLKRMEPLPVGGELVTPGLLPPKLPGI